MEKQLSYRAVDGAQEMIYQCKATFQGVKGIIQTTNRGLIFESHEDKTYFHYRDILNVTNIERGDRIYHRLLFNLNPVLLFFSLYAFVELENRNLSDILMFCILPVIFVGIYFRRYWNFILLDLFVDHRNIYEVKFRFRFIDMIIFNSLIRAHLASVRSKCQDPFDTSSLN